MARQPSLPAELAAAVRRAEVESATGVMRVEIVGDVGYLYFLDGDLVHASTLDLEGEPAAIAISTWGVTLAPCWCERRWPRERSVTRRFFELAEEAPERGNVPKAEAPVAEARSHDSQVRAHSPSSSGLRQALGSPEFANALRLTSGVVRDTRGNSQHLRAIVLSTVHLGDSVGAALGLGPLLAAEASEPRFHRLVARNGDELLAAETTGGNALPVARAFLKLG